MKKLIIIFWILISVVNCLYSENLPAKPTRKQIANDLIGIRLKEGKTDGWYSDDWHWDVKKGQIKALKILSTLENNKTDVLRVVIETDIGTTAEVLSVELYEAK